MTSWNPFFWLLVWWIVLMLKIERMAPTIKVGHLLEPWFGRVCDKVEELTERPK